jgi:hypothetical protein
MDGLSLHRGANKAWGYNNRLLESDAKTKVARARVLRTETVCLLVVAVLILGMILVRWGHFLNWHAR